MKQFMTILICGLLLSCSDASKVEEEPHGTFTLSPCEDHSLEDAAISCWPLTSDHAELLLSETSCFAHNSLGISARPSVQVAAFNTIMDDPEGGCYLARLARSSNPVSQLYAMAGYQILDSEAELALMDQLSENTANVAVFNGCEMYKDAISDIAGLSYKYEYGRHFREGRESGFQYFEGWHEKYTKRGANCDPRQIKAEVPRTIRVSLDN